MDSKVREKIDRALADLGRFRRDLFEPMRLQPTPPTIPFDADGFASCDLDEDDPPRGWRDSVG